MTGGQLQRLGRHRQLFVQLSGLDRHIADSAYRYDEILAYDRPLFDPQNAVASDHCSSAYIDPDGIRTPSPITERSMRAPASTSTRSHRTDSRTSAPTCITQPRPMATRSGLTAG